MRFLALEDKGWFDKQKSAIEMNLSVLRIQLEDCKRNGEDFDGIMKLEKAISKQKGMLVMNRKIFLKIYGRDITLR